MINIRLPNITAQTEKGQLEQIRSYLYQFAEQLNWALNNIDKQATEAKQKVEATTEQKDAVEQAHETFSEVKSLIIKSADIVNAYYTEISHRLDGLYVAESDFGKYKQETSATFEANSEKVSIRFDNQQAMITDIGGNVKSINEVLKRNDTDTKILGSQAWVKIGVLDYEDSGFPIYGMEVGQVNSHGDQTVSKKFAQYRSDGVHLFDQSSIEVAVISDRKLYITNAEMHNAVITNALDLGGYTINTGNGLAFKWKGRV